jgi:hypothetical protein
MGIASEHCFSDHELSIFVISTQKPVDNHAVSDMFLLTLNTFEVVRRHPRWDIGRRTLCEAMACGVGGDPYATPEGSGDSSLCGCDARNP